MTTKMPFLKFYTSDWRADPALRMCGLAARGLWAEMICLMHEATPYGHLLVNGNSVTDAQLAALVGTPSELIPDLLGELETAGVFSRTRAGVIYSRKLAKMAKKTAVARKNGKSGGNPTLSKTKKNPALDKPPDKGRDKPQRPEARGQRDNNSEDKSSSLSSTPDPGNDDGYFDFLKAHPRPRETARGEEAWSELLAGGTDPQTLIAAAQRYADASKTYDADKVKFADNWLVDGAWRLHLPSKADAPPDQSEKRAFWAKLITAGGKVFGLSEAMAADCVAAGLVSQEQASAALAAS
ncbi:MAG: hypothetical protein ACRBB0_15285 [Pelagimonas sp.]|uniref:hypothetical protein n=1 Tax=Pelagimonas sp. TaxID=2073170 RepID=UPI003D6B7F0A